MMQYQYCPWGISRLSCWITKRRDYLECSSRSITGLSPMQAALTPPNSLLNFGGQTEICVFPWASCTLSHQIEIGHHDRYPRGIMQD